MKFPLTKFITSLTLGIFLLNACSRIETANQNENSTSSIQASNNLDEKNNAQTSKDDVEELGRVVNLPFTPEETNWREEEIHRDKKTTVPSGKKLIAILKFSAEDAANVTREAEKYKPGEASEIDAETWFPAELIAQSQLSGDESLKGASFAADDFIQPPYSKGKLTRIINTDYFVLELTTF